MKFEVIRLYVLTIFCLICCGMAYLYGQKSIMEQAVQNKFATFNYENGKFQWNTNLASVIIKSHDAETEARRLNRQTYNLVCVTTKAMQTVVDAGVLLSTLKEAEKLAEKTDNPVIIGGITKE